MYAMAFQSFQPGAQSGLLTQQVKCYSADHGNARYTKNDKTMEGMATRHLQRMFLNGYNNFMIPNSSR
jgi:hypothetical protein